MDSVIVLDIETSPMPWDTFDDVQHEYLLRGAQSDEDKERKRSEMALAPFTGMIVCVGFIHLRRNEQGVFDVVKKVCLMRDADNAEEIVKEDTADIVVVRTSEARMLQHFWTYLQQQQEQSRLHFVTFNGRGFDMPFLMLRSAALRVRPSVNLMSGTRFNYRDNHTDLLDELTFFAPQQNGATRRFNLDFYTKTFGISSPKSEGVDGSKVAKMYEAREYVAIAEYCMRDIEATWELYRFWRELLKY
ncbi:MAG: ribonuclease H-like domain-containing protein [Candidatus Kapaibacterium sp.]|jgi:DNA polymerase elongation subunit (family B)